MEGGIGAVLEVNVSGKDHSYVVCTELRPGMYGAGDIDMWNVRDYACGYVKCTELGT